MEPTTAPQPPSATTAVAGTPISDSVTSSPRYRTTNSFSDDNSGNPLATNPAKLRLMCSYGGHIVPRPHDKTLCYVGGETRIVAVDRHTTLSDLTNRLTKTLIRSDTGGTTPFTFTIKYQLPSEDLDSLISVSNDEDLENMIDEYDRLNANKSSRLRLFLFLNKLDSVTSIGSLLESTNKSDDWFLNALNGTGTNSGFSDTSSVNCLLGLEDDASIPENNNNNNNSYNNQLVYVNGKIVRGNRSVQDVQSVPDSPMLENSSSFGSASSGNLPPMRVNDEQQKVGIEEQFAQMSVQKHKEDVNFVAAVPAVSKVVISEDTKAVVLEDERSEQGIQIGQVKQHQIQQQLQFQQKLAVGFDMASPDSVSSDGSVTNPISRRKPPVIYQDPTATSNIHDQNTRTQIQDSAYVVSSQTSQVDPQHPQLHNQQQFIHTAVPPPQYLQHYPSGAVPVASYYQMYPSQSQSQHHAPLDQHNFVYYMPARQPIQGYNLPLQADPAASAPPSNQVPPPSGLFTASRAVQPATKTEPPAGAYRTTTSSGALPAQLVQVPSSQHQMQPQFVGYSHIHQPSQPVASGVGANYVYDFTDPSQQGQHIYYAAQPLPPQSAAQFQTIPSALPAETPAGSNLQADNSLKQQVRTSQP